MNYEISYSYSDSVNLMLIHQVTEMGFCLPSTVATFSLEKDYTTLSGKTFKAIWVADGHIEDIEFVKDVLAREHRKGNLEIPFYIKGIYLGEFE